MINIDGKQIKLQIWDTVRRVCDAVTPPSLNYIHTRTNTHSRLGRNRSGRSRGPTTEVQLGLFWYMTSLGTVYIQILGELLKKFSGPCC